MLAEFKAFDDKADGKIDHIMRTFLRSAAETLKEIQRATLTPSKLHVREANGTL